MSDMDAPLLSPQQFLELEEICDAFERDLETSGRRQRAEAIVEQASPEIRHALRQELNYILSAFEANSHAETCLNRERTLTPDDAETRLDQFAQFAPAADIDQLFGARELDSRRPRTRFGRLWLYSIVGRGGSGIVWRAFDKTLNRWVALKISHRHSIADSQRFVREARAVAQLKHPNIIPVFEAGELDGRCFLVSEFCDGQPLSKIIGGTPMDPNKAVETVRAITAAVAHSHSMGIIHRDLKPQNVMVTRDGVPMVTDFGLAKSLAQDQTLTLEGDLIGTPAYMAPEQASGDAATCDERSDIYSIGVVLYQLLSGSVPFSGSFERVVFQLINTPAPRLQAINPDVPTALETICTKCLEKSPKRRFQSADALNNELSRFLEGQPISTRQVSWSGQYLRWLQRAPVVAWTTTACVALLFVVAIGSSLAAWAMMSAWQKEKSLVSETRRSLAEAEEANKRENEARKRAVAAEEITQKHADLARRLAQANRREANFLTNVFAPLDLIGINKVVNKDGGDAALMTVETIKYAERKADELLADAPIVKARIKGILGNAWRSRGRFDKAQALLQEALGLLEQCGQRDDQLLVSDFALNSLYWAYLCHHREDFEASQAHYRRSIALHRHWLAQDNCDASCALQLAQAEFGLGALFLRQRRNELAKPLIESALKTRRRHLAKNDPLLLATELTYYQCDPDPEGSDLLLALQSSDSSVSLKAISLYWKLIDSRRRKDYAAAIGQYQDLIELISSNLGKDNPVYLLAIGDFAGLLRQAGDYERAFIFANEAVSAARKLAPWHSQRMSAMMLLAHELALAGRHLEAKELLLEVANHQSPRWSDADGLHLQLAWCYFNLGDFDDAVRHSQIPLRSISSVTAANAAWICHTHASMLAASGAVADSSKYHDQALATVKKIVRDAQLPEHSTWLRRMGEILTHHGLTQKAEHVYRLAIRVGEREYSAEHPRVAGLKILLAKNLIQQQSPHQAKPWLRQALRAQSQGLPSDDQRIASTKSLLQQLSASAVRSQP